MVLKVMAPGPWCLAAQFANPLAGFHKNKCHHQLFLGHCSPEDSEITCVGVMQPSLCDLRLIETFTCRAVCLSLARF